MFISELSKKSGFSLDTIRYYEKIGLIKLPKNARLQNNYKTYSEAVLSRLEAIQQLKAMKFTLKEIKAMLDLRAEGLLDCETGKDELLSKIQTLDEQIKKLQQIRQHLSNILSRCPDACQIMLILDKGIS